MEECPLCGKEEYCTRSLEKLCEDLNWFGEYFHYEYTPEEAEDVLERTPLTQKRILHLVDYHLKEMEFKNYQYIYGELRPFECKEYERSYYKITIGLGQSQKKREIALIHEIIHGLYKISGGNKYRSATFEDFKRREKLIEDKAKAFYNENKTFVKDLYSQLYNRFNTQKHIKI